MAITSPLAAERRKDQGSAACRRLRRDGFIPGNIYGHHQDAIPLAVSADKLTAIIKAGAKVVELQLDGKSETSIFREVQWDTFGVRIQHFDLLRVDADERVEVNVRVDLKGTAPGVLSGGILEHHLHELSIECPAIDIPDAIIVRIGELQLEGSIHVRELELPPNVKVLNAPEEVVVHVGKPMEEEEPTEGEGGPAQPELIGRKPDADEEDE